MSSNTKVNFHPLINLSFFFCVSFISLEFWSYEFLVLMSGLLPNPKLETSVMSIWSAFKHIFLH